MSQDPSCWLRTEERPLEPGSVVTYSYTHFQFSFLLSIEPLRGSELLRKESGVR